jgi:hypothetical protein
VTTLVTARLVLGPHREDDLHRLHHWENDPELVSMMSDEIRPWSLDETRCELERWMTPKDTDAGVDPRPREGRFPPRGCAAGARPPRGRVRRRDRLRSVVERVAAGPRLACPPMDTLFDAAAKDSILSRIETLRPDSPRGWGKLDPAQMLAHCALGMEAATGDAVLYSTFMAKLIGPLFKKAMLGPKPFSKSSPTHPMLVLHKAPCDFAREKARLAAVVRKFHDAGPASAAKYRHAFVQTLTGDEWGVLQWKHLDHHLRQFGA